MRSGLSSLCWVIILLSAAVTNADLVNRYSFDNGDTTAVDSIGSQHGTLEGDAHITDNAVQLDGYGDYVNLPADLIAGHTSITLEFWFTLDTTANWARVFDFGDISGSTGGYYLFYTPQSGASTSRLVISDEMPGSNHEEIVDYTIPVTTVPVHVAFVYDGENNTMSIYEDGEQGSSTSVTIPLSSVDSVYSFLGRSLYYNDPYLTGSIDEFRIYDYALEDWEIQNSFNFGPDSPYASYAASNPDPSNNSTSVIPPIDLSWSPPAEGTPDSYTVYVSDNPDFNDPQIIQVSDGNSCTPELDYGLSYYWRVDTNYGQDIYQGAVWNFFTCALSTDRSPVGDIVPDFEVNIEDLELMADEWLSTDENSPANLYDPPAMPGTSVDFLDLAVFANNWLATGPLLVINEFMADNKNYLTDPNGEYDDWIEIYNCSNSTIDLSGMYLTDNLEIPTKWYIPDGTTIPGHGYLLFWADEQTEQGSNHTNFKLDAGGEEIALFDTDGSTLLDSVEFEKQYVDLSNGRYPDCGLEWRFFDPPTPLGCNCQGYLGAIADLEFSVNGGVFSDPAGFDVYIRTDTKDVDIYYTTDFTEPTESSQLYTGPIHIDSTTCLRAIAYKEGWLSPHSVSRSYIYLDDVIDQPANPPGFPSTADYQVDPDVVYDEEYEDTFKDDLKTIPTISIVTSIDGFWGSTNGIYANPSYRGDAWERQASIEFIDPCNTENYYQANAGIRIHGAVGRASPKKSIRVIFRSSYGPSKMEFPLFEGSDVETFDQLVLRGTWNYSWVGDSDYCSGLGDASAQYMRELYSHDTIRDMDGLQGYGRHVHLYIDGLYWGLYILTERPDEEFAAEHLGGDSEDYDAVKTDNVYIELLNGDLQAWNTLFALAQTDLSDSENYAAIQEYLDIPALIDYMAMIFHVGSRDAPVLLCQDIPPRNFYAIRKREPGKGFIFIPWDVEWSLENETWDRVNVSGYNSSNNNPAYLIVRLKANEDFRMLLADRIHELFFNNGTLTVQNTIDRYLNRIMDIDRAIVGESARWGDTLRSTPYTRNDEWITERNRLINNYFPVRRDNVLNQLRSGGYYPDVDAPEYKVNSTPQHGGYIQPTDSISVDYSEGTVYYTTDGNDPRLPSSGGDTTEITLVSEDASKNILVPESDIGTTWRGGSEPYDDSSWTDGTYISGKTGGVGYERSSGYENYISYDVESEMFGNMASCYIRIPFTVEAEDLAEFDTLTLYVRCDDGFVAFINGVEVESINKSNPFEWNSSCANRPDDSTFAVLPIDDHITDLHAGINILAIHALNQATDSSDFLSSVELIAETGTPEGISLSAIEYTAPFTISSTKKIMARVKSGDDWSALSQAAFVIDPVIDNIRITEIMYNPIDTNEPNDPNTEFIEVKNIGAQTLNLNLINFSNGLDFTFGDITLNPDEHIIVVKDIDAFEAAYGTGYNIAGQYTGSLANEGERIRLEDGLEATILDFKYKDGWRSNTDGDGYSLTIINPDEADTNSWDEKDSWRPSAYVGGSPGWDDSGIIPNPGNITINEVLAHTDFYPNDWIELHNTTGSAIDLTGWYLSDDDANLAKYELPSTTILANDYVVFTQDDHFGAYFALSENGDNVYLSSKADSNGFLTGYREQEDFGASENGVAFGKYLKSTGTYNFVAMSENTPGPSYEGAANAYPKVGPVVISEIMYNPDVLLSNWDAEYIELNNITTGAVNLYDDSGNPWKITDGVDFTFPAYTSIPPGGCVLIVQDVNIFNDEYPDVPPAVQLFEWDSGRLDNAGEKIELAMPGDLDEFGVRQYIRIDRVVYSDGSHPDDFNDIDDPWPIEADGTGDSLERIHLDLYGNDPNNWDANTPSPGVIPGAEYTILTYDDFETGWGSYTDGGDDCARLITLNAHQGDYAANIQDDQGDDSSFWHDPGIDVDTPNYTQIKVDFWFKASGMDTLEYFKVKYFDGSDWNFIKSFISGIDFVNGQFYPVTLYINEGAYDFPSDMKLKFECVASGNTHDIFIDEIAIYAK